jgi:hypothetical protein
MHVFHKTGIILILLSLCSCIGRKDNQPLRLDQLEQQIKVEINNCKKQGRDEYLHLCQSATLLFYNSDHKQAATFFEQAHQWIESHYTKSTSKIALAKILNERVSLFRGHYLERYQFRLLAGINHLCLNNREAALVEFRRLSREIRLSADPFGEKRSKQSLQQYSALTGLFFTLLKRGNEGSSDLKFAYDLNPKTFPKYLKNKYEAFILNKTKPSELASNKNGFIAKEKSLNLFITLSKSRHTLASNKISLTMLKYWPIIKTEVEDHKNYNEIENIVLGSLGKRVISVSFATPKVSDTIYANESDFLDFNKLYNKSWQLQKTRLIKTTIYRVLLKLVAANAVAKAIESKSDNGWGQLLANIGRTLIWETEKADLRVINYLPSLVEINWEWVDKDSDEYVIEWKDTLAK